MIEGLPLGIDLSGDWQQPRVIWVPDGAVSSAGPEAIDLAEHAGLHLDVWQQFGLAVMMLEAVDGRWLCPELGMVVSRQNGKGGILEGRELAGLFLLGEKQLVHSAHLFDTAQDHMKRMIALVEGVPEFSRRIKQIHLSKGQESIELVDRRLLKFKTRTLSGGRGLSGDFVAMDEAMIIPEAVVGALMPTLTAFPNQQMVYTGSAVNQQVHQYGYTFAKVRHRGLNGDDRLGWLSWTVDPDVYNARPSIVAADPKFQRQGNPALGIRVSADWLESERRQMGDQTFAAEVLGVGDWPEVGPDADLVIPRASWDRLASSASTITGDYVLAVDTTPERSHSAIAVAGARPGGGMHFEVTGDEELDHQAGTRWVPARLREIVDRNPGCKAVVIDSKSPAASLAPALADLGIVEQDRGKPPDDDHLLVLTDMTFMVNACAGLFDEATDLSSDLLSHPGQQALSRALGAAKKRDLGDRWAWARKSAGDISPLVAVTLALHGASTFTAVKVEPFAFFR